MLEETEVRVLLAAVEPRPTRVDVHRAVHDGRRRARRRWYASAGMTVAAVAAVAVAPAAVSTALSRPNKSTGVPFATAPASVPPPTPTPTSRLPCPVSVLPVPAGIGDHVEATAVDPTGRYVGGNGVKGQDFIPILWTDGKARILPVPAESGEVSAVNRNGVVVGLASSGAADNWIFRYDNGKVTRLNGPPGYGNLYPVPAINSAGDVVVNAEPVGEAGGANSIALLWKAGTTTAHRLPLPPAANVFGIEDDGTLIGTVYGTDGVADAAYTWDLQGHGRKLPMPAGLRASGYAIGGEWATGSVFAGNSGRPVRWNLRTGALVNVSGDGVGNAVNASGWVVVDARTRASAVFDGTRQVPLATVGPGTVNWVNDVSDTNLVVGMTSGDVRPETSIQPATWQC
jgi:hypothetical protein